MLEAKGISVQKFSQTVDHLKALALVTSIHPKWQIMNPPSYFGLLRRPYQILAPFTCKILIQEVVKVSVWVTNWVHSLPCPDSNNPATTTTTTTTTTTGTTTTTTHS